MKSDSGYASPEPSIARSAEGKELPLTHLRTRSPVKSVIFTSVNPRKEDMCYNHQLPGRESYAKPTVHIMERGRNQLVERRMLDLNDRLETASPMESVSRRDTPVKT